MACLLHEKPFAGVNGSGKHVNFSIGNAPQGNLLDPGRQPARPTRKFLVFCGAVIRAVHRWAGCCAPRRVRLERSSVGPLNEAPQRSFRSSWAISSMDIFEQVTKAREEFKSGETWKVGVDSLRSFRKMRATGIAQVHSRFTGNRFEFRQSDQPGDCGRNGRR